MPHTQGHLTDEQLRQLNDEDLRTLEAGGTIEDLSDAGLDAVAGEPQEKGLGGRLLDVVRPSALLQTAEDVVTNPFRQIQQLGLGAVEAPLVVGEGVSRIGEALGIEGILSPFSSEEQRERDRQFRLDALRGVRGISPPDQPGEGASRLIGRFAPEAAVALGTGGAAIPVEAAIAGTAAASGAEGSALGLAGELLGEQLGGAGIRQAAKNPIARFSAEAAGIGIGARVLGSAMRAINPTTATKLLKQGQKIGIFSKEAPSVADSGGIVERTVRKLANSTYGVETRLRVTDGRGLTPAGNVVSEAVPIDTATAVSIKRGASNLAALDMRQGVTEPLTGKVYSVLRADGTVVTPRGLDTIVASAGDEDALRQVLVLRRATTQPKFKRLLEVEGATEYFDEVAKLDVDEVADAATELGEHFNHARLRRLEDEGVLRKGATEAIRKENNSFYVPLIPGEQAFMKAEFRGAEIAIGGDQLKRISDKAGLSILDPLTEQYALIQLDAELIAHQRIVNSLAVSADELLDTDLVRRVKSIPKGTSVDETLQELVPEGMRKELTKTGTVLHSTPDGDNFLSITNADGTKDFLQVEGQIVDALRAQPIPNMPAALDIALGIQRNV